MATRFIRFGTTVIDREHIAFLQEYFGSELDDTTGVDVFLKDKQVVSLRGKNAEAARKWMDQIPDRLFDPDLT